MFPIKVMDKPVNRTSGFASVVAEPPEATFPLAPAQESLWLSHRLAPDNPAYNLFDAWLFRGDLDVSALQRSLNALVARHETLRTLIRETAGKPLQAILPPRAFALSLKDLSSGEDGCRTHLPQILKAEVRRPIDLQSGPLARAVLYRVGEQEHVFLCIFHHIISDEWSLAVLRRELSALYGAELNGGSCALPELPVQYADIAVWQREMRAHGPSKELQFWKQVMKGPLPEPPLHPDYARTTTPSFDGITEFVKLNTDVSQALKNLSRQHGTTLFMTLLAAYKVLLHRFSGETDIIVGSPLAGRGRVETEGLIGMLVNTLPFRTDLAGDPTFAELLGRVRSVALDVQANQDVSLQSLIEAVRPERRPDRHPLFQTVFALQPGSSEEWSFPGITASRLDLDNGSAKFDWALMVSESNQELVLRSEFGTDLFSSSTASHRLRAYTTLLESIVLDPSKRISDLPLLQQGERELLQSWSTPASARDSEQCVHALFERQAAQDPGKTALIFRDERMTYGELDHLADRLADQLREAGAGVEDFVAVCLDRSFEMIAALVGVLKVGCTFVPLDRTYPVERLAFMLKDTGAKILITDDRLDRKLLGEFAGVALVLKNGSFTANQPSSRSFTRTTINGESLAYVMYTSGSTGVPKGVGVPHKAIVRLVRQTNYVELSKADTFLQLAPISFDASTFEIWGALLNGATLVLAPPGMLSFAELARIIRKQQISVLWLTSGLFNQMVDYQLASLTGVKQLLAGGEALSVPHVLQALRGLPVTRIINGYGPTENTTFSCCYTVPSDWKGGLSVPIGQPISNTQAHVLDQHRRRAPIGAIGELYVGGDGLARGYLNQPELTHEKFVDVDFGTGATRLYRTGDLARWLPGGLLEFIGRIDGQVKVRGFRVELGEVEQALRSCPTVGQALVLPHEDASGTRVLVAYVVIRSGISFEAENLRAFLSARLPNYMVPLFFIPISAIPLTPNGKIDRNRLPKPEESFTLTMAAAVAPGNELEQKLHRIWSDVLGHDRFGVKDNFFMLGGHSLLATQVVSRVASVLGVDLPVSSIFEAPTIETLARLISHGNRAGCVRFAAAIGSQQKRASELLARLDQLTDEEVEALLNAPEWNSNLAQKV